MWYYLSIYCLISNSVQLFKNRQQKVYVALAQTRLSAVSIATSIGVVSGQAACRAAQRSRLGRGKEPRAASLKTNPRFVSLLYRSHAVSVITIISRTSLYSLLPDSNGQCRRTRSEQEPVHDASRARAVRAEREREAEIKRGA